MAEKNLNSRIVHKHDIEVNWSKATNFIPKIGEIIVYDPDENHAAARVKIGDGVKTVVELAFIDDAAKAALFKEIDMVDEKVEALGQLVGDASIPEQIEEALLKTQADWEINDETSAAYVKNRPFYEEIVEGEILPLTTINFNGGQGGIVEEPEIYPTTGETYIVEWNNNQYTCIAHTISLYDISAIALGNSSVLLQVMNSGILGTQVTTDPFVIIYLPKEGATQFGVNVLIIATDNSETANVKIIGISNIVHKIDPKFLHPEKNSNLVNGNAVGSLRTVTSTKEDETYSLGEQAMAIGYGTKASGNSSFASGNNTIAQGISSHAEGLETSATGNFSHAEGRETIALGEWSHAEGYETVAGGFEGGHAEGLETLTIGAGAHAEGRGWGHSIKISGLAGATSYVIDYVNSSHPFFINNYIYYKGAIRKIVNATLTGSSWTIEVERTLSLSEIVQEQAHIYKTFAQGDGTHAEGIATIASTTGQHVQGRYNIEKGYDYAHIVGNGKNDTTGDHRSNAHTLDWSGNAWFAGDVYVSSTSGVDKDEGSKKLATEEYVGKTIHESVSDWNTNDENGLSYVKNRTHYDNSFEFTYNGNPEEYEHIEVGVAGNYWVKISSEPITKDALIGSTILLSSSADSGLITEDFLTIDGTTICLSMLLCSVFEEYSPISGITLNRGIWISHQASMYLQSIYKFDVHQLDPKFIPTASEEQLVQLLIDIDALPAMTDSNGAIFTHKDSILLI